MRVRNKDEWLLYYSIVPLIARTAAELQEGTKPSEAYLETTDAAEAKRKASEIIEGIRAKLAREGVERTALVLISQPFSPDAYVLHSTGWTLVKWQRPAVKAG